MAEIEDDEKNREIVRSLLESFGPIARSLTPEIEPATVYRIESTPSEENE